MRLWALILSLTIPATAHAQVDVFAEGREASLAAPLSRVEADAMSAADLGKWLLGRSGPAVTGMRFSQTEALESVELTTARTKAGEKVCRSEVFFLEFVPEDDNGDSPGAETPMLIDRSTSRERYYPLPLGETDCARSIGPGFSSAPPGRWAPAVAEEAVDIVRALRALSFGPPPYLTVPPGQDARAILSGFSDANLRSVQEDTCTGEGADKCLMISAVSGRDTWVVEFRSEQSVVKQIRLRPQTVTAAPPRPTGR